MTSFGESRLDSLSQEPLSDLHAKAIRAARPNDMHSPYQLRDRYGPRGGGGYSDRERSALSHRCALVPGGREKPGNRFGERLRPDTRGIPFYDTSFAIDKKFGEIPFDFAAAEPSRGGLRKPAKQRIRRPAFDVNFREHGKCDPITLGTEGLNVGIGPRFLPPELMARKGEYHKPPVLIEAIQGLEARILRGKATAARDIDD